MHARRQVLSTGPRRRHVRTSHGKGEEGVAPRATTSATVGATTGVPIGLPIGVPVGVPIGVAPGRRVVPGGGRVASVPLLTHVTAVGTLGPAVHG